LFRSAQGAPRLSHASRSAARPCPRSRVALRDRARQLAMRWLMARSRRATAESEGVAAPLPVTARAHSRIVTVP
jgi:hypothetical protein